MNDARQGRPPRAYAQNILRHAKAAHMTSVYNQLSLAWNNLALEFRRDVPEPTSATTLSQFLNQIDSKKNIWYEMARQNRGTQQHVDKKSTLPKQPVLSADATRSSTIKSCLAGSSTTSTNHRRVQFAKSVFELTESSIWRRQRIRKKLQTKRRSFS